MKIVFMGTPDFAVGTLQAIVEAGHDVAAVVTQPDKRKGRGKEIAMTPVKEKALEYGITVYQPEKVRAPEFIDILRQQVEPIDDADGNQLNVDEWMAAPHIGHFALHVQGSNVPPNYKPPFGAMVVHK